MKRSIPVALVALLLAACAGPAGKDGANGTNGSNGSNGTNGTDGATGPTGSTGATGPAGGTGANGCDGVSAGQSRGLTATIKVSAPANGQYFAVGEQATVTMAMIDGCGRTLTASALGTANLYLYGPKAAALTKTASKLLNANTDRSASDGQHHYIKLGAPHYGDPTKPNLTVAADGSYVYKLAPVSDELPGTYTAGLWAKSTDDLDQFFPVVDFQVATATVEPETVGIGAANSCLACHKNLSGGFVKMHHSVPGFSPNGNFSLDANPVATCKSCHNADGYSQNTTRRKVHAIHRGSGQMNPGVAHPEYGEPADATLADYTDVVFPAQPGGAHTCTMCHVTDAYKKNPARSSCGTCHDNVFFDTGTLTPPRTYNKACVLDADCKTAAGTPGANATCDLPSLTCRGLCQVDNDCVTAGYGNYVTCDSTQKICMRKSHIAQTTDGNCLTCHGDGGLSPISERHEVYANTKTAGFKFAGVSLIGASGPGGSFKVGDVPVLKFQVQDATGAFADDLKTNASWAGTVFLAGPANNVQRVYGATGGLNVKTGGAGGAAGLAFDAPSHTYTFTFPSAWPASAQLPINSAAGTVAQANVPGTYDLWFYASKTTSITDSKGLTSSFSDTADSGIIGVKFGADLPVQTRQVVLTSACNACHGKLQVHGGSRQNAQGCISCHNQGAQDRIVGSVGTTACVLDTDCRGFAMGWERCTVAPGASAKTCNVVVDPTPGAVIDFPPFIHNLHFARLREGYTERNNTTPGRFAIYRGGGQVPNGGSGLYDFGDVLIPTDARSCVQCHASTNVTCASDTACGYGQSCIGAKCQNTAWKNPSGRACLTCHDSADAWAHAQIQTFDPGNGQPKIESCEVCHGVGAEFQIETMHSISNPYKPPYARTP